MTAAERAVVRAFRTRGGRFVLRPSSLIARARTVRAFLFDWDGVFNDGFKLREGTSGYAEPDAMGVNLLRYGYYRLHGEMPLMGIVTGERNPAAREFAMRMKLAAYFEGVMDKSHAVAEILEKSDLSTSDLAWVFDDVNDLHVADACRLRILVNRPGPSLLASYAARNDFADYITASTGGRGAVREVCELLLAATDEYDEVLRSRVQVDEAYRSYWMSRPVEFSITNA